LAVLRRAAADDWFARRLLVKLLREQGNLDEALAELRRAADAGDRDAREQRTAKEKARRFTRSLPLLIYSAPGGLRQDPGRVAQSPAEARTCGHQGFAKYVCSCHVWVSRDVEPPVGLAVRLRALGAEVRVCAPPDCAEQLAEMQPAEWGFHD
jgi:hypothetical protein